MMLCKSWSPIIPPKTAGASASITSNMSQAGTLESGCLFTTIWVVVQSIQLEREGTPLPPMKIRVGLPTALFQLGKKVERELVFAICAATADVENLRTP